MKTNLGSKDKKSCRGSTGRCQTPSIRRKCVRPLDGFQRRCVLRWFEVCCGNPKVSFEIDDSRTADLRLHRLWVSRTKCCSVLLAANRSSGLQPRTKRSAEVLRCLEGCNFVFPRQTANLSQTRTSVAPLDSVPTARTYDINGIRKLNCLAKPDTPLPPSDP